jgi:hypothetical protein
MEEMRYRPNGQDGIVIFRWHNVRYSDFRISRVNEDAVTRENMRKAIMLF